MPRRVIPLQKGKIYHIANYSVEGRPVFTSRYTNSRAILTFRYYQWERGDLRLSHFLTLSKKRKEALLQKQVGRPLVEILSFCLMPSHYHIILKQRTTDGISRFVGQFQNSFTRYFNEANVRSGSLFRGPFKSVGVPGEKELLLLSRHIHLNPYRAKVVRKPEELREYQWSSLPEYLAEREGICQKTPIFSHFRDPKQYQDFVFNRDDYQKSLNKIRHILLEEEGSYRVF